VWVTNGTSDGEHINIAGDFKLITNKQ